MLDGTANIPPYAIGPALIAVGALMMMNIVRIPWDQSAVMLPCFVTIITIPLTFSIAYGACSGKPMLCLDLPFSTEVNHQAVGPVISCHIHDLFYTSAIQQDQRQIFTLS